MNFERRVGNTSAQLAGDIERLLVRRLGQHHREFLAADARYPIDSAAQRLLQAQAELLENLIAAGVTQRVIGVLEKVDVAEDERERPPVASRTLHLTRKVFAEKSSARDARQIVCRRQLAILDERDAQYSFELCNATRCADASVQLTF